jgi:hypothetical protein
MDWVKKYNTETHFYFNYKKTNNIQIEPLDAALYTVKHISEKYPPPYTLMLSGGVDSQAMLYAWHVSKIPYNTFSAIYNYNLNDYDLNTLKEFSSILNIDINYENFDLFNFLETEYPEYTNRYLCGSPHICTYMKLADTISNGTVIMSGNFIQSNYITMPSNLSGLLNYKKISGRPIVPFFFLETEELAWAFNDYTVDESKDHGYMAKVQSYQHFGFPVIPQSSKLHGFEKVKEWFDHNYHKPIPTENKLIRIPSQGSNRIFDLLYRNKYEAKFSKYKYIHVC